MVAYGTFWNIYVNEVVPFAPVNTSFLSFFIRWGKNIRTTRRNTIQKKMKLKKKHKKSGDVSEMSQSSLTWYSPKSMVSQRQGVKGF